MGGPTSTSHHDPLPSCLTSFMPNASVINYHTTRKLLPGPHTPHQDATTWEAPPSESPLRRMERQYDIGCPTPSIGTRSRCGPSVTFQRRGWECRTRTTTQLTHGTPMWTTQRSKRRAGVEKATSSGPATLVA